MFLLIIFSNFFSSNESKFLSSILYVDNILLLLIVSIYLFLIIVGVFFLTNQIFLIFFGITFSKNDLLLFLSPKTDNKVTELQQEDK